MAAVAASNGTGADKTADLLQKLSLESKSNNVDVVHGSTKKFGSYGSGKLANGLGKPFERSQTPIQDLSMYYGPHGYLSAPYYYPGYDTPLWNDYRYLNHDLANLPHVAHHRNPTQGTGQSAGYSSRVNPTDHLFSHLTNIYRGGPGFSSNYLNAKPNWPYWTAAGTGYPARGQNNGLYNYGSLNRDRLNELSKGPRCTGFRTTVDTSLKPAVKGQDVPSSVPDRSLYNKEDFPESYSDAKFFIIKSYSEDDIHKSIKHNVWASTPNGNKKLDAAYKDSQGKADGCPVFLLFSVNASGQFVGLAEMTGNVDFERTMDFWQVDKWIGCIPLKWRIVKDIPNSLLKHIKLEYNDNKPITNSRDTQEVKLEQGLEVLKIFKLHSGKTSVLDDFEFYEARERSMQERRTKRQLLQKQVKDASNSEDQKSLKTTDVPNGVVEASKPEATVMVNGVH